MSEPRQASKDEGTYTQVPNVFFDTCDLPETAQILYLRLYREIHYKGCVFSGSIRKLSKLVRLSKSTVDRMIKKLQAAHLITIEHSQSDEEVKEIMTITLCKEELWTLNKYHHHVQPVPIWDTIMPETPADCPKLGQDVPEMGQDDLNLGHSVPDVSSKGGITRDNNFNNFPTREESVNQNIEEENNNPSPSQEKSLNEEKETKKPDQVELFRATFIALGKEYFQYDKFTASKVQPNSDVYARILDIIGDGDVSPQSMRIAFLKLYNCKDKDGTYWWRDKSKLTLKAFANNYNDQDDTLQKMDVYERDVRQSAGEIPFTEEEKRQQVLAYYSQPTINGMTNFAASDVKRNTSREKKHRKDLITAGPLAGQPDYHADPWT